jgi:hypothetical protein
MPALLTPLHPTRIFSERRSASDISSFTYDTYCLFPSLLPQGRFLSVVFIVLPPHA